MFYRVAIGINWLEIKNNCLLIGRAINRYLQTNAGLLNETQETPVPNISGYFVTCAEYEKSIKTIQEELRGQFRSELSQLKEELQELIEKRV